MLYRLVIPLAIAIVFYGYSPTLMDFEPQAYKITTIRELSGPLQVNSRLSEGKRLFEGEILGPESLAVYKGDIYTGTSDGCITKVTKDGITCFTKLKKECEKGTCASRPLGLRFDKEGTLYVVDGILGLFSINMATGSSTPLLTTGEIIGGEPLTFPDDLSISSDGIIYFSDGSVRWNLHNVGFSVVEHENSGRIIRFDTKTNESSVLVDKLYFPNGVQLSKSEDTLLISELSNQRILKHYLKGKKKGQTEVFVNVPGYPDNIRSSKRGYWISLVSYNNPAHLGIMDRLSQYPFIRKIIVRFEQTIASLLLSINGYWKSQRLEDFANELQTGFNWILPTVMHGMGVEVDENGKFIGSIQSPDGKNSLLSEILEMDGQLFCGSFLNPYLIQVNNIDT